MTNAPGRPGAFLVVWVRSLSDGSGQCIGEKEAGAIILFSWRSMESR